MSTSLHIERGGDSDDECAADRRAANRSTGKSKRGRGCIQRLQVQVSLLTQSLCGYSMAVQPATGAGPSSHPSAAPLSQPSMTCWNSWVMLLLLLQLLLLFALSVQRAELATLRGQVELVNGAGGAQTPGLELGSQVRVAGSDDTPAAEEVKGGWLSTFAKVLPSGPGRARPKSPPFPVVPSSSVEGGAPGSQLPASPEFATPQSQAIPSDAAAASAVVSYPSITNVDTLGGRQALSWEWSADSYEREREIYTILADQELLRTPAIVQSFRAGKIDWHNLLPAQPRPATPNPDLEFSQLVASEQATTAFLTHEFSLHRYWNWGTEHGPMRDFANCRKVNDKCNVHPKEDCLNNGLCGWCPRASMCVDRFERPLPYDEHEHKPACQASELELGPQNTGVQCAPGSVSIVAGGALRKVADASSCRAVLTDRFIETAINPDAGAMYYHFIKEHFEPFYSAHYASGQIRDRYTHVLVSGGSMEHFHDYFGILTRICPRYLRTLPEGACFCRGAEGSPRAVVPPAATLGVHARLTEGMVAALGLEHVTPPRDRPALGLLSRENKRFLLNELELARIAVESGVSFKLLPLEYMSVYEQVREFRRLHWLTGIHGSGLTNYFLLHRAEPGAISAQPGLPPGLTAEETAQLGGAAGDAALARVIASGTKRSYSNYCQQLMPHGVTIGGSGLRGFASQVQCVYEEWVQPLRSHTVLHTHFLSPAEFRSIDSLMAAGPRSEDSTFFSFWVNQDTIIQPDHWRQLLLKMIKA